MRFGWSMFMDLGRKTAMAVGCKQQRGGVCRKYYWQLTVRRLAMRPSTKWPNGPGHQALKSSSLRRPKFP